jgi:hypothetical protein
MITFLLSQAWLSMLRGATGDITSGSVQRKGSKESEEGDA